MFSNILLPTDGSEHSERAVERGIELGRLCGAAITGLHVLPDYLSSMAMEDPPFENRAIRETLDHTYQEQAARFLDFVRSTAAAAGLRCHTVVAVDAHPYNAIVDTANEHRCDLIVMTARHHHGLASLVMRSEAERVLHRSSIPVLTFRALMSADHPDHADRKPVNWLETFREYSGRDNPAARP